MLGYVHILQLIVVLCCVSGTSGLLCYSCNHISTSEDCMNVVECTGREECFIRADGYTNGTVLFSVGCTYDMVPIVQKGQTFCSQVCNEDLCNLDKCQLPVSPRSSVTRPPRCLSCDLIDGPEQCKNLVQCQTGEMCFIRKVVTFGNNRYRLGCMNSQHCSSDVSPSSVFVGKRSDSSPTSCSLCCSKDHCNIKACGNQHAIVGANTYNLNLLRDENTCIDFNPTACAAFGSLNPDACKAIADIDNLCPASCGMCGHFGWTDWGAWSTCSQSCDGGISVRDRICIYQVDAARIQTCVGESNDTKNCTIEPCAVHGHWSEWSNWGNCSVTCENGTRIRHRECTNPEPRFGGMNCTADSVDIEECSGQPCPVNGGWCTEQGKTCRYNPNNNYDSRYSLSNSYAKIRTTCACPAPQYGGEKCKQ